MRNPFRRFYRRFLNPQLDFRVRLFNSLAIAGMAISVTSTIGCLINDEGAVSALVNFSTGIMALALMEYAYRTGRYRRCYLLSIFLIFVVAFPAIFFVGGGYQGGMPSFFVFATVFTVFMLEGWRAVVMLVIELSLYIGACIYSYYRPDSVSELQTELAVVTDNITGFVFASISLSITLLFHFRLYNQQQRELEQAREEALKLSETKSNFLANMSHEIRTPINVMLGMNEMVLRESDSERISGYGLSIQSAGKTLLTLINNILDVSKIESGKLEMVEENYYLNSLIEELSVIGKERTAKRGLRFWVEADDALPSVLYGDFIHIKQIAVNFLSNAVKYTEQGSVTLLLNIQESIDPDHLLLRISVRDTGTGIKPENQERLFDAFTRLDLPSHRNVEGTGLGLAIAKQLAELMQGRITVESEWGKGSVFSLDVPQRILDRTPRSSLQMEEQTQNPTSESVFVAPEGNVLVVDDNRENLQVAKALLGRTLLQVDTADSGQACLEAVKNKDYHIILMDYMMPGLNGVETLHRLRAMELEAQPAVIALTANAIVGVEELLLGEGFDAYLTKPILTGDLERALMRFLPQELVTRRKEAVKETWATEEVRAELAELLTGYGVALQKGLRYLGGDLSQYKKLTEFFTENYEQNRAEAELLVDDRNWEALCYTMHSQKSKALAVGATGLHFLAANLEQRCRDQDTEYILCAWPLLLLEWERVCAGLEAFIRRVSQLEPASGPVEATRGASSRLMTAIRAFRHKDAEIELERMLASADEGERQELLAIRRAVSNLDFERAEEQLLAYLHKAALV